MNEPRSLALVDPETAGEIGDGHVADAEGVIERRLQCHRRVRGDPVLPAAQAARRRDVLSPVDPARERLGQAIGGFSTRLRLVSAVG